MVLDFPTLQSSSKNGEDYHQISRWWKIIVADTDPCDILFDISQRAEFWDNSLSNFLEHRYAISSKSLSAFTSVILVGDDNEVEQKL